ncbi:MAG: hypothetical protein ACYC9I_01280, partial [Desulfuromonadales bacterium]
RRLPDFDNANADHRPPLLSDCVIASVTKHTNGRGGACSAQSGRGKQRPYIGFECLIAGAIIEQPRAVEVIARFAAVSQ